MDRMEEKEKARKRWDRTHRKRNRAKEFLLWARDWDYVPVEEREVEINRAVGFRFNDMAKCSCSMCGNPRRYFDELTLQEKKQLEDIEDQLKEFEK